MSFGAITHTKNAFLGLDKEAAQRLALCVLGIVVFVAAQLLFSPLKSFLLVGFFFLLVCSWQRPLWVVIALAFLLPFEPFLLKWISDDIYVAARYASEVAIYVVCSAVVLKKIINGERIKLGSLGIPLLGFAAVALLSTLVNQNDILIDVMGLRQLFRFILLAIIMILATPSEKWIKLLVSGMLGIMVFQSMLGISQALAGGSLDAFLAPIERKNIEAIQLTGGTNIFWQEGQRIFATLGRYDQLGTFLCFFILLACGALYERGAVSPRWKNILVVASVLAVGALIVTYSRASWFGLLLGIAVVSLALKKDRRVAVGFLIAAFIAVGVYATLGLAQHYRIDVANQTIVERFFEAFSPERMKGEYYALGRMYFLSHTPPAVLAHAPLVGVGPGAFGAGVATALHATDGYTLLGLPYGINGTEGYVDNNWLSLLGETGYVGLVFYVVLLMILFRSALRVYHTHQAPLMKGLALGYCGALAAFAFQGLFATYFEVRTIAPYIWLFGGVFIAEEMKCRELPSPLPSDICFRGRVFSTKNPSKLPPSRSVNPENRHLSDVLDNSQSV